MQYKRQEWTKVSKASLFYWFTKLTYLRQWYRVEEDVGVVLCGFIQLYLLHLFCFKSKPFWIRLFSLTFGQICLV